MWIRSQSKCLLINTDEINVYQDYESGCYLIRGKVYDDLGVYLSREKALKVLDQIQYNMELFEHELTMVFQMPTDNEVDEV